ncbi:hypothetical protein K8I28_14470, partial [bacterium]|nr:hypothetical protein [bacterium]
MELNRSDHPYLDQLQVGDRFDSYYVLQSLQLATTRKNKPFLILTFSDRSGTMKGKMWEDAEEAYRILSVGQVVKIRATTEEYQGNEELKVIRIRPIDKKDMDDYSRFLPTSTSDLEQDWQTILDSIAMIENEPLRELMNSIFEDEEIREAFRTAPAGKKWHHGYIGGLLEHTASIVKLASWMCEHYADLKRDILISGALLHD